MPKTSKPLSFFASVYLFFILCTLLPIGIQALAKTLLIVSVITLLVSHRSEIRSRIQKVPNSFWLMSLMFLLFACTSFYSTLGGIAVGGRWSDWTKFFILLLTFTLTTLSTLLFLEPLKILLEEKVKRLRIDRIWIGILLTVTLVAVSQWWFRWKLHGVGVIPNDGRATGFFSHPLTLAYLLVWFWPLVVARTLRVISGQSDPRKSATLFEFFSCVTLLSLSMSLTVVCVAIVEMVFMSVVLLKGRLKVYFLAATVSVVLLSLATPNPFSDKLYSTLDTSRTTGDRTTSEYASDRFIFWRAHLALAEQKPLFGHGLGLSEKRRAEGFNLIGMENFEKKFNAHNFFIQLLAEVGVLGFLAFFAGVFFWTRLARDHLPRELFFIFMVTVVGFFVASLTQNTLYDSEVRYAWIGFWMHFMVAVPLNNNTDNTNRFA